MQNREEELLLLANSATVPGTRDAEADVLVEPSANAVELVPDALPNVVPFSVQQTTDTHAGANTFDAETKLERETNGIAVRDADGESVQLR